MKVIIASGYFSPCHLGHCQYLTLARQLGDRLVVIVNNDAQVLIKGSKQFMNETDRAAIVGYLRPVDEVVISIDQDKSVCRSIELVAEKYHGHEIVFAKGGDRFAVEIPESKICSRLGIAIVDGLGEKIRASSEILKQVKV